jgi:serine/threonine protein kinase
MPAEGQLRYRESFMDATGDHLCIATEYCAVRSWLNTPAIYTPSCVLLEVDCIVQHSFWHGQRSLSHYARQPPRQNGTLEEYIKNVRSRGETIDPDTIVQWAVQIALAMQYVHSKRILHRDLKTANIFLTKVCRGVGWPARCLKKDLRIGFGAIVHT